MKKQVNRDYLQDFLVLSTNFKFLHITIKSFIMIIY